MAAIDQAVEPLRGLVLQHSRRIVDLQAFAFGNLVENAEGERPAAHEFFLHVQCRWRIVRDGAIAVGSADISWPPSASAIDYGEFDYDGVRSRRDELVEAFLVHGGASHGVERVQGSSSGDLRLSLADGCMIELWPDHRSGAEANGPAEHWRFFRRGARSHFVVTAHGAGYDDERAEKPAD